MRDVFFQLTEELSKRMGIGQVSSVHLEPMRDDEQGYSGAKLIRLACVFSNRKTSSLSVNRRACPSELLCSCSQIKNGDIPIFVYGFA